MSSQLFFSMIFGTGAVGGVALSCGALNWRSTAGKITTIAAGLFLLTLTAFVVLLALWVVTVLPGMIALP